LIAVALLSLFGVLTAQAAEPPRLVVAVSVDQFCQDYLIRFRDNFAEDGLLRRIQKEGAEYTQCHHQHSYTVTAPGHAVQFTGTYANRHGIIGNDWYDRATGKKRYCVEDADVEAVGLPAGKPMSPKNLLVDTVGDKLKMANGDKSKVIGVAIKDRAAILMTGHLADAAYWLEKNQWVTSTHYRDDLPGYLRVMNEQKAIDQYRGQSWALLLAANKYHNQTDDVKFENAPAGFTTTFPHKLAKDGELNADKFGDQVLFSPFGNDYTLLAAREIIIGERLGHDETPDFLGINFSSTDYVGHAFGPNSLEVEDMAYRTDKQLGAFARFLDTEVGEGRWTLLVTADHAVAPIPEVAAQMGLPGKRSPLGSMGDLKNKLEQAIRAELGVPQASETFVLQVNEHEVFLRAGHPRLAGANFQRAQEIVRDWLIAQDYVATARTRADLLAGGGDQVDQQMHRSFHPRLSGDVFYVLAPYCITGGSGKGTTHGSPWHYDTHVPCLLLGNGIQNGRYDRTVSPACMASTVAELVGVDAPAANEERPLYEALGR
jgi:predicted AlkP superfamily pyrophosphatase or phosphodiesterase